MKLTRIISIAVVAAFGLAANTAIAQGGYGSLSHFSWEVDQSNSPTIESAGVRAVGGYMFSDIFGIEAHVASGGTDDTTLGAEDAEAELNKMFGAFAKLNLPLNVMGVGLDVFGLAGYGYGRLDILAQTTKTTISENSFAWGAGADVALIPDRLYLTADYIDYISRTGIDGSAASLGLRLAFGQ